MSLLLAIVLRRLSRARRDRRKNEWPADAGHSPPAFRARSAAASGTDNPSPEFIWELLHDAIRQRVGHVEDVIVDSVVRSHVAFPILVQASRQFSRRRRQMCVHHVEQSGSLPIGIRLAEEIRASS